MNALTYCFVSCKMDYSIYFFIIKYLFHFCFIADIYFVEFKLFISNILNFIYNFYL